MNEPSPNPVGDRSKQRYTWPWFLLAAIVLGIALAIIWMSREVQRTRQNRELNAPTPAGK